MQNETLASMFRDRVKQLGDRTAYRFKSDGRWQEVSWSRYGERVEAIAMGLAEIGLGPGETVAILSTTRPEWDLVDRAALAAGGVPVGIYHSNTPDMVSHIIVDAGARVVVVEDEEQLAKVLSERPGLPRLERIILIDGSPGREEPGLISLEDLENLGAERAGSLRAELERRQEALAPDDTAIIFYTSGTTGPPKGAVLTHGNVVGSCRSVASAATISRDDMSIIWLPLPHIYQRIGLAAAIYLGSRWSYAQSIDTLVDDIAEIRPTVLYSVPRVYEKIYTKIRGKAGEGPAVMRRIFEWSVSTGRQISQARQAGQRPGAILRAKYAIASSLVLGKVRTLFGGRIRFIMSGGAPIAKEIIEFFHACGILTLELYGITETLLCTSNLEEAYRFGSVGRPVPGVEIRTAEDGEILVRSDQVYRGYLNQPEMTAEVLTEEGWYHTGDIGTFDDDGYLYITDRKKDIIITAGGKNVAPQNIENLIKTNPFVSQVMVYGDRRKYLTALVTLDPEEIAKWAGARGFDTEDHVSLCRREEVVTLVDGVIREFNKELPSYETIKKFAVIADDFTQESGELTPTMKVKRKVVTKRYWEVLDGFYEKEM